MVRLPDTDEIEISVFGHGYGESILVHTGRNEWLIIDSCADPTTKEPSALKYLTDIGAKPEENVRLVVASHWHDDHIRGLGEIVKHCPNAKFVCSDALLSKEFLSVVSAYGARQNMNHGLKEFYSILLSIEEKKCFPKYAIADRLIWSNNDSGQKCEVFSLSPSDKSKHLALLELASLYPQEKKTKKDVLPISPNHVAIVLWIRIGNLYILLGSDLEATGDVNTGWDEIIFSQNRPKETAAILKVPHHGSAGANHQKMWSDMLKENPISVLTPFILGKVKLPKQTDIDRINSKTNDGYITSVPKTKRQKKEKIVEQFVQSATKSIHTINKSFGHIQIRTRSTEKPAKCQVQLFGAAVPIKNLSLQ